MCELSLGVGGVTGKKEEVYSSASLHMMGGGGLHLVVLTE